MATKRSNPLMEQERRKAQQEELVKQAQVIAEQEAGAKKCKLTLSMPEADIAILKKMAIDQKTTVSGLIHTWIASHT